MKAQMINFLIKNGISIKNGKIAKADVKKVKETIAKYEATAASNSLIIIDFAEFNDESNSYMDRYRFTVKDDELITTACNVQGDEANFEIKSKEDAIKAIEAHLNWLNGEAKEVSSFLAKVKTTKKFKKCKTHKEYDNAIE